MPGAGRRCWHYIDVPVAWRLDADFADLQQAAAGEPGPGARVRGTGCGAPGPGGRSLYREPQAVTPDSLRPLLHDLFEANTL
jgi:hypothetical protein